MAWNGSNQASPSGGHSTGQVAKARANGATILKMSLLLVSAAVLAVVCYMLFARTVNRSGIKTTHSRETAATDGLSVVKAKAMPSPARPKDNPEVTPHESDCSNAESSTAITNAAATIPEGSDAEIEAKLRNVPDYERDRIRRELIKMKHEPLRGGAEQLLALSSVDERGERMPPIPVPDDSVGEELLQANAEEMLDKIGRVEEWDNETTVQIKERLERLKDEYAAAREKGLSFAEFIRARQKDAAEDREQYEYAMQLDKDNYNSNISDKDYLEAREKLNKVLRLMGFKEVPKTDAEYEDEEKEEPVPAHLE